MAREAASTGPERLDDALDAPADAPAQQPDSPKRNRPARRELLPDIDRINSTLDASGAVRGGGPAIGLPQTGDQRRKGFRTGFLAVIILAALAWTVYAQGARLTAALPQAAPLIEGFTGVVDDARLGLDRLVRDLLQGLNG